MTEPNTPLFTSRRHRTRSDRRTLPIVGGIVALLVVVAAGWWWMSSRGPDETAVVAPAVDTLAKPEAQQNEDSAPALDASDEFVRRAVAGVSARPNLASWLVTEGLARRFVLAAVQAAHGRSPAHQLDFMAPSARFKAKMEGGQQVIDPASYHRYDAMAATIASLDTQGTVEAFHRLHPLFEKAYAELGLKDQTFDETVRMAFQQMLAVQVPDPPVEIEPQSAVYGFTSTDLEKLAPVQKQLVRMGPDNAHLIQAKLRELADALGLDLAPQGGSGQPLGSI